MVTDFASYTRAALRDASTPLWLPTLTSRLAETGWEVLQREVRLTPSTYATARILRRDPEAERNVETFAKAVTATGEARDSIPVELLPQDLAVEYEASGIRFYGSDEIAGETVSGCLDDALIVLGHVPTLVPTVCSLIRALHVIEPPDDEIDVSFSEPRIPFSAFVSVPPRRSSDDALRVAEGLLHEAMHLQLTLVEAVVPLLFASASTYFSPWRNEQRSAQGVLHALYVFRVIDAFLEALLIIPDLDAPGQDYVRERRSTIRNEIREIKHFGTCPDLTPDGAAFVVRLLDSLAPVTEAVASEDSQ